VESDAQSPAVDLRTLLRTLRQDAERTRQLADRLSSESKGWEGSSERLIDDMAENLAALREFTGVPRKDAEHFKTTIKRRQESSR
jgi:hypothetical protein